MKVNLDHVVLIVSNISRTATFYSRFLGKPVFRDKESVCFKIGKTRMFFVLPWKKVTDNKVNINRIGLNHVSFGVKSVKELETMKQILDKHGIKNKGIRRDEYENNLYLWFEDDDGICLECYVRK